MIRFKVEATHEPLGIRVLERRFTWDKGYTFRIQNRIAGKWVTCYQTSDYDTAIEVYENLGRSKIYWGKVIKEYIEKGREEYAETVHNDAVHRM